MALNVPHRFRIRTGPAGTKDTAGNYGAFKIPFEGRELFVVANDGSLDGAHGWDHVSVSLPNRTPTWEEMCEVKRLFFDAEDCVIQFHPPRSRYVNVHPYCLHMWRLVGFDQPIPPKELI